MSTAYNLSRLSIAVPFATLQEASLLQKLLHTYSIVVLPCSSYLIDFAGTSLLDFLNLSVRTVGEH